MPSPDIKSMVSTGNFAEVPTKMTSLDGFSVVVAVKIAAFRAG